jgi:hypothetical protein
VDRLVEILPGGVIQVQIEKIIRENRFQGGRKSALSGCNSHFHMYAKTQLAAARPVKVRFRRF